MKIVSKSVEDKSSSSRNDYKKNTKVEQIVESVKKGEHKKNCDEKNNLLKHIDSNSICSESSIKVDDGLKPNEQPINFLNEENILKENNNMVYDDIAYDMNRPEANEPNFDYSDKIITNDKKQIPTFVKHSTKKRDVLNQLVRYFPDENNDYVNEKFYDFQESDLLEEERKSILMTSNEQKTSSDYTSPIDNISTVSKERPLNNLSTLLCYFLICMFFLIWCYVISLIFKVIKSRYNSTERRNRYRLFIQHIR